MCTNIRHDIRMHLSASASPPIPSADKATEYVRNGIHQVGGWREALGGLWHSTLPAVFGIREKFGVGSVIVFFSRGLLLVATALFPLLVRKSVTSEQSPPAGSMLEGLSHIWGLVSKASYVDYVFGAIAIAILAAPKINSFFEKKSPIENHSPFYDLTAALQKIAALQTASANDLNEALKLALQAMREEMAMLIGDSTSKRVTDVTLLEFCDSAGSRMQVRSRTANHVGVKRPVESGRLVAFYVAKEGRNFAEHDFRNRRNPFPSKRVSVRGFPEIDYRSVLYIPIVYTEIVATTRGEQRGTPQVVESCGGVICVHSSKPFRFWRWGDHKRGVGGFADVAFERAMPYITFIEKLLSSTAHKVALEVK